MDSCIIQNHHDSIPFIFFQETFQKGQEFFGGVLFFLYAKYFTGFIIQRSNQLRSPMLAVGGNDFLLPLGEPGTRKRLVIPDHGLIFKQNPVDAPSEEFFLTPESVL